MKPLSRLRILDVIVMSKAKGGILRRHTIFHSVVGHQNNHTVLKNYSKICYELRESVTFTLSTCKMEWTKYIKACIFDLDGVIVDTAKYHFEAWKQLGAHYGFHFDEAFNEQLKGVSRADSLRLILQQADVKLSEQAFDQALVTKNNHYLNLIKSMNKNEILPGVLSTLIRLAKNNIPIALGSASKNAKVILASLELMDFFDFISDGNLVVHGKPHPETFLLCSENFGINPEDCIVFEDSMKGIQAANTGGFKSVGLGDASILSEANRVYKSFTDMNFSQLITLFNS